MVINMTSDRSYYQDQLNTEALNTATIALTKIEDLETHTNQQLKSLKEAQTSMKDDINRSDASIMMAVNEIAGKLDKFMWLLLTIGGACIMILLGIVGYLLVNGQPWSN